MGLNNWKLNWIIENWNCLALKARHNLQIQTRALLFVLPVDGGKKQNTFETSPPGLRAQTLICAQLPFLTEWERKSAQINSNVLKVATKFTISVNWSAQAIRICSGVKGLFSTKSPDNPLSFLAAATASHIAKNTEHPKKIAGSPMPCHKNKNNKNNS